MYLPPIAKINRTRASYDVKRFSGQTQFFFFILFTAQIKNIIYTYIYALVNIYSRPIT